MSSTPPRVSGDPDSETHRRWVEEQIAALQNDVSATGDRLHGVEQSATNAGNLASGVSTGQGALNDRVIAADSNNRLARPITDAGYWTDVQAGRKFVWERPSATPGVTERSTWRNVTWNASGSLTFQPNGSAEGAEAHVTPILPIPTSSKLYVEAENGASPAGRPQIWIEWLDGSGIPLDPATFPATLATSKSTVSTIQAQVAGAQKYTVKLVRPAGAGIGATIDPKVFEVVGTDGLAIGPGGISVEDGSGNKTIEINPSLPVPAAPTAPILSSSVGSNSVRWNGSLTSGPAGANVAYVYAEESTTGTSGWGRVGQTLNRAGDIITRPPVGATRWYRFIAVDTSNRPSLPSAAASITTVGVDIPDLSGDIGDILDTVDGLNKIFYETIDNVPTAHANGDLWFVVDGETSIVREVRIWNGTIWNPYRIVADSVIVPGSVGTITLGDGVITGPKVATRTLTAENIQVGSLGVDVLTPNIGSSLDISINPSIADLESGLEQQQRYYRFDDEGLKIGDPATNEELRLNPGRIEMVQAGNVPTYWEAQTFYVARMVVQAANIGEHRWEKYATGRSVIRPL